MLNDINEFFCQVNFPIQINPTDTKYFLVDFKISFVLKRNIVQVPARLNREPRENRGRARRCNPIFYSTEKKNILAFLCHCPELR